MVVFQGILWDLTINNDVSRCLPSGYVNVATEHHHFNGNSRELSMVIFNSYVSHYRVDYDGIISRNQDEDIYDQNTMEYDDDT